MVCYKETDFSFFVNKKIAICGEKLTLHITLNMLMMKNSGGIIMLCGC